MNTKFGFVTCVELGLSCIEAIYQAGSKLDLVITLDDYCAKGKSGRIYLDDVSKRLGFKLIKTDHINTERVRGEILQNEIDWLFVVGWSQIVDKSILNAPKRGVLGMHPTLLPEGRGRAAIPWAIIKGLKETGVTLFKVDDGVDTGDIIYQEKIALDKRVSATELYETVTAFHVKLVGRAIDLVNRDAIRLIKQDDFKATYWPQRRPEDGEINLNGSVYDAERLVRAVTKPYPGAFFVDPKTYTRRIIWKGRVLDQGEEVLGDIISFHDGEYLILE